MKKITTMVWRSGETWVAAWSTLRAHTYSSRTKYGARTVMKPTKWVSVPGKFNTSKEARAEARRIAAQKCGGGR